MATSIFTPALRNVRYFWDQQRQQYLAQRRFPFAVITGPTWAYWFKDVLREVEQLRAHQGPVVVPIRTAPPTQQLCRRCDGTGTWIGVLTRRPCFGCDGSGLRDTEVGRLNHPRPCLECGEAIFDRQRVVCPGCRRAQAADRPVAIADEKRCDCGRGERAEWLDGQRVCIACWTDAYQPQLKHTPRNERGQFVKASA